MLSQSQKLSHYKAVKIITIVRFTLASVTKVSPLAQSIPNSAKISPAYISLTSSISVECKRTKRGTRT